MVDARLPDGSRVNVVIHPLAIGGPFLTIRKFAEDPYQVDDLVGFGSITPQVAHFIKRACAADSMSWSAVAPVPGRRRCSTCSRASSPATSASSRSRTPRSSSSTRSTCSRCEARPPNIEGKGEVKIRDLVRNALRMRPDRIVVGEVRGGEALDMLQAMNTGHDGSLTTVHSERPRDTLSRIETMC